MGKIKVEISRNGDIQLEFVGFVEKECEEERERLRNVLSNYGVTLSPKNITKKKPEQITSETKTTAQKKTRAEVGY